MTETSQTDLPPPRRKKLAVTGQPSVDRIPPHALEAEQGVLGCIMLSPNECMAECIEKLKANAEAFYDLRHQILYSELLSMYDERLPIETVSIMQRLKKNQLLEQVGGIAYIASLPDFCPSAASLGFYLDTVLEKYVQRQTIHICTDAVVNAYDGKGNAKSLPEEVATKLLKIGNESTGTAQKNIRQLVASAINKIEEYHNNQGKTVGISTGFPDLDKMTTGLNGGEMIVIAARPSCGKTSLAMGIAENVAIDQNIPVGVFSLEMSAESLVLRMICSRSRVSMNHVREGFLAERDFPKITSAAGRINSAPIIIDDSCGITDMELRAKARRMHQQHGIKLIVIDYLQLLHCSKQCDNRQQEITHISNSVKALAKDLNVPVIVLSQLNRDLEKRGIGARPKMSDLRESGAIEQDADLLAFLFKDNPKEDDEEKFDQTVIPIKLYICKQRNGPVGDVDLTFLKEYTRFESAAKISMEDVPV